MHRSHVQHSTHCTVCTDLTLSLTSQIKVKKWYQTLYQTEKRNRYTWYTQHTKIAWILLWILISSSISSQWYHNKMSLKMAPTMDNVLHHAKMYFQCPPFFQESWEKIVREKLQIDLVITLSWVSSSKSTLTLGKQTKNELYTDLMDKVSDLCWKTYLRLTLSACLLWAVGFDR